MVVITSPINGRTFTYDNNIVGTSNSMLKFVNRVYWNILLRISYSLPNISLQHLITHSRFLNQHTSPVLYSALFLEHFQRCEVILHQLTEHDRQTLQRKIVGTAEQIHHVIFDLVIGVAIHAEADRVPLIRKLQEEEINRGVWANILSELDDQPNRSQDKILIVNVQRGYGAFMLASLDVFHEVVGIHQDQVFTNAIRHIDPIFRFWMEYLGYRHSSLFFANGTIKEEHFPEINIENFKYIFMDNRDDTPNDIHIQREYFLQVKPNTHILAPKRLDPVTTRPHYTTSCHQFIEKFSTKVLDNEFITNLADNGEIMVLHIKNNE